MKAKAILFLFIFISFLVIPTVVSIINHQVDVSFVFSLAEEETKKGKEVELFSDYKNNDFPVVDIFKGAFFEYDKLSFNPVYLNLISPPPKC